MRRLEIGFAGIIRTETVMGGKSMEGQKKSRQEFEQQMSKLLDNWPVEPERAKRLSTEYYSIFKDVCESRFRAAVTAIIAARAYTLFPTQAEFRGYIPAKQKVFTYCGKCIDGWIYNNPESLATRLKYGIRRCECNGMAA